MHRDAWLVLSLVSVGAAACGSHEEKVTVSRAAMTSPGPAEVVAKAIASTLPDPIAKGVPHGGTIRMIAATEAGDAALTVDDLNTMRLWPTLDGTRSPVPVASSSQPEQLALLRDGRELVATVLDSAGGVTLTRLGLDGSVRGRVQLGRDGTYVEVAAVGDQVLARTADHKIELYAADGTPRGHVVPAHGQRITDLVTRKGRAAAVVATAGEASLRWLDVTGTLRWDIAFKLPLTPRENMLALAPNRRRIAFVDVGNTGLHVFDLGLIPIPVLGTAITPNEAHHHGVGFIDDDTAIVTGLSSFWWTRVNPPAPQRDPWATPQAAAIPPTSGSAAAAVADGHLITAPSMSLALSDPKRTRYLGWTTTAITPFTPLGSQVVMMMGAKLSWFDENLALVSSFDLNADRQPSESWSYGVAIGPHHVLSQSHHEEEVVLELRDTTKPTERVLIGRFPRFDRHEVVDGMLAVIAGRNVRRFKVDFETTTVRELLPALKLPTDATSWVRVFDPEVSGGLVAAVGGWDGEYSSHGTMWVLREHGKRVKTTRVKPFDLSFSRSDRTGRITFFDNAKSSAIVVMRGEAVETRIEVPGAGMPMVGNSTGTQFAFHVDHDVVVVDAKGKELWRKQVWALTQIAFMGDTRLAVAAPGGYLAFDAATGARVARECAWNFGLHDKPPETMGMGFAPVCEDPVVQ